MNKFIQRFHSKYTESNPKACWIWQGPKDSRGYGLINRDGKRQKAHRIQMELQGHDIADLFVCHHCDNPSCVNPNHLFLGTIHDNNLDRDQKGRNNPKCKLTPEQIHDIRSTPLYRGSGVELSRKYQISEKHIRDIRKYRARTSI